jgi:predicted AAA+ superfamily ATPase
MPDPDPMQLTLSQRFELERMYRTIDETNDIDTLRKLCKETLRAWQMQKAATAWAMRQGL